MVHCYKPSSYPSRQCKCQEFKNHDVDKLCLCFIYVEKSTLNNGCRASGKQMGWATRLQQLLWPARDAPAMVASEASAAGQALSRWPGEEQPTGDTLGPERRSRHLGEGAVEVSALGPERRSSFTRSPPIARSSSPSEEHVGYGVAGKEQVG